MRFPALRDFLRSSGSGTRSTQPVSTIEELLGEKVAVPVYKIEKQDVGIRRAGPRHSLSAKVDTNFADRKTSFGRYSSLAD
jgi:hypothetical protein